MYKRLLHVLMCSVVIALATVSATAQGLTVSPQSLTFTYQVGGPNPPAQNLLLSAATPSQFVVTVSGAPWLTVMPTSGLTPSTLVVTVTAPANATPGTLSGNILIGPPASPDNLKLVVPVNLQVLGPPQGTLQVSPQSLTFDYQSGAPNPPSGSLYVTSTGAAAGFNLTTSTNSGGSWLSLLASNYITPAQVIVQVTPPIGMQPGIYTGSVNIVPSYAGGNPLIVPVTLRVAAAGNLIASPGYLTFSYQAGSQLPIGQTVNVVNSNGGPVAFVVSASTTSGGSWLSYAPSSGSTPTGIVVNANPGALAPGTYYGTILIVPSTAGVSSTQIPVTFTIYGSSQLIASPTSLTFNYQSGGPSPAAQYISVTSTDGPVTFTGSVYGLTWVTLSTNRATTPIGIAVFANPPSGIAPGTYNATVTFVPTGPGNSVSVGVSVVVSGANYLTVGASNLSFNYAPGGKAPAPAVVPVTSSSGSIRFDALVSTLGFGAWLQAAQSSQYTPANVTITVNPQGLAVGTYAGAVTIVADGALNSPQTISVSLTVASASFLTASPFGVAFSYQIGAADPPYETVVISSGGTAAPFSVTTETTSGGNWLLAAGGGSTPGTVAAAIATASLAPGKYTGNLVITPGDSSVPTLRVPVVLSVAVAPVFLPSGDQVVFQYQTGGPAPAAQKITIDTSNRVPTVFYPTVQTSNGGAWLKVTPDVTTTPADLTVSVSAPGLPAGFYYGVIVLNDASGAAPSSYVPVTLQVSDNEILTVPAQSLSFTAPPQGAVTASQPITVRGTGRTSAYHVSTNGASWLRVSPTDGVTDAVISISADPDSLTAGYYLGVVSIEIPGVSGSQQYVPVVFVIKP